MQIWKYKAEHHHSLAVTQIIPVAISSVVRITMSYLITLKNPAENGIRIKIVTVRQKLFRNTTLYRARDLCQLLALRHRMLR